MKQPRRENIMGTKPIGPLLTGMAVPIMLSMLVQAFYNIIDSIFVSRISENALTSVSLIFPIQNLMIAVAVGTAVGINSLLSRRLGEKNYEAANKVANNGVFITVLSWAAFAVFGLLGSDMFMRAFTDNAEIAAAGASYLRICTVFSFGLFMQITIERLLQVTGKTVYQMCSQMTGAILNIILDPILIFGWFGLPRLGVTGAAIATVIGQMFGMIVGLVLNHLKNHEIRLVVRGFRPCGHTIYGIYQVGLPSIVMQSIGSVMTFGMNKILISFTETAVSVFGVYFRLQSFVFMPVFGITNAVVPIVGYNFGAAQRKRIVQAVNVALGMSVAIMLAGTLIFQFFPIQLLQMFNASEAMLVIGVPALRLISLAFCLAGIAIVLSSVFQATGAGMLSLAISIVRQLVVLLPMAWVLSRAAGLNAVWWSFPLSELVAVTMALLFYRKVYTERIALLPETEIDNAADF